MNGASIDNVSPVSSIWLNSMVNLVRLDHTDHICSNTALEK